MATELGAAYVTITASMKGFNKEIQRSLSGADGEFDKAGKKAGGRFSGAIGGVLKTAGKAGLIGMAAGAAMGIGTAFTKGLDRYMKIENAEQKLKALGNSAADVEQIMKNANAAVKGTAFGMGEAADTAAAAVASGIKPGQQLEQVLTTIANAAAISGTSMSEMGAIFNKAAASGKVQGDILAQLGDRGVPVVQFLAKELGVTAEEVYALGSAGKISFEQFERAMRNGMDPKAAVMMGQTLAGSWANAQAALGRLGAEVMKVLGPVLKTALDGAIRGIDTLTKMVGPALGVIKGLFAGGGEGQPGWMGALQQSAQSLRERIVPALQGLGDALRGLGERVRPIFEDIGRMVGEFVNDNGPAFQRIWESIVGTVGSSIDILASQIRMWTDIIGRFWDMFGPTVMGVVRTELQGFVDFMAGAWGTVEGIISGIAALLRGDWSTAWTEWQGAGTSAWGALVAVFETGVARMAPLLDPIGKAWQDFWTTYLQPVWAAIVADWNANVAPVIDSIGAKWAESVAWVRQAWTDFKTGWDTTLGPVWQQIRDAWTNSLRPALDELRDKWSEIWDQRIKPIWNDLKATWDTILKPAWDDLKATWDTSLKPALDDLRDTWDRLWYQVVKPIWQDLKAVWDSIFKPAHQDMEGNLNSFSGGNGGEGSGPRWARIWQVVGTVFKFVAESIIGQIRGLMLMIDALLTVLDWMLTVFRATLDGILTAVRIGLSAVTTSFRTNVDIITRIWSELQEATRRPVSFVVNTVINGLIDAWNAVAGVLGLARIGRVSFGVSSSPPAPTAGRGSVPQYAGGGWTGPGGKYQPAGLVHADEFVVNKQSRGMFEKRFPGFLTYINEHGDLPGYAAGGQVFPVPGYRVTRGAHGVDRGVDIAAPMGARVVATRDTTVTQTARLNRSYGWYIRTALGEVFAHLSAILVNAGQSVRAGQQIGRVGSTGNSTGPHLHYVGSGASGSGQGSGSFLAPVIDYAQRFKDSIAGPLGRLREAGDHPFANLAGSAARKISEAMTGRVTSAFASISDFISGPAAGLATGARAMFGGHAVDPVTAAMLGRAQQILGQNFRVTQGSFSTRVSASGSTHAGAGAVDIGSPLGSAAVNALRRVGFAAWFRPNRPGVWGPHIHAIANVPGASAAARAQYQDFLRGGDGLLKGGVVTRAGITALSEDGRPELAIGPQYAYAPAGTRVFNADDTQRIMSGGGPAVHLTINNPLNEPSSESTLAASALVGAGLGL